MVPIVKRPKKLTVSMIRANGRITVMNKMGPVKSKDIELNEYFLRALELMENSQKSIFITGKAGTGKSTLLDYFRNHTKKKIVVLAPTGVAALNVRGQTIHSFFRFKPGITIDEVKGKKKIRDPQLYKNIETIVIDEISMVRADLLDCVDQFLRKHGRTRHAPFGGIQMIFIGDLYQLPPVVTTEERDIFQKYYTSPYFFDAKLFNDQQMTIEHAVPFNLEFIELEKIYRQRDDQFIRLLNAIRNNSVTEDDLEILNRRVNANLEQKRDDFSITLTTTNREADEVNGHYLAKLGTPIYTYEGFINGSFDEKYLPTQTILRLRNGSQVMFLNNDAGKRWVNGTIGKIIGREQYEDEPDSIIVQLSKGNKVKVTPNTWEIFDISYNGHSGSLETEIIGSFIQYPLKLAWAVTIHKSQGKTFDNVIIDLGRGTFAHGQLYVALSRATSIGGIVLKKPVLKRHVIMDWRVVKFMTRFQYQISEQQCGINEKIAIIEQAIRDQTKLSIVYLKSNDEKSRRMIRPSKIGEMEYLEKSFLGLRGYCFERKEERTFRVDRILNIESISD